MGALNCKSKRDQMTVNPETEEEEDEVVFTNVPKNREKMDQIRKRNELAKASEQKPSASGDETDRPASSKSAKSSKETDL